MGQESLPDYRKLSDYNVDFYNMLKLRSLRMNKKAKLIKTLMINKLFKSVDIYNSG